MKKQNLMAFAISLIVLFAFAVVGTAFVPFPANETSQSVTKSVNTDTAVADFAFSAEKENRATVNFSPQKWFQTNRFAARSSGFIARETGRIQINYTDLAANNTNNLIEQSPELNSKFEIIPNWQSCKMNNFFTNDYRPELVWRE